MSLLSEEKFELLQKWHTLVTLMGFTMEEIFDDWSSDDDDQFLELLEVVERVNRLTAEPTNAMTAVLRTIEMGVTSSDINNYSYELEEREEQARQVEIMALEAANPIIVKLTNEHNFKWITDSKQYPNHKHYSFTTEDGILVKGRTFNRSWGMTRNWLTWKEKGKTVSQYFDTSGITIPAEFPKSWSSNWGTIRDANKLPLIIANYVVNKTVPKVWFNKKFKYPTK